MLLYLIAGFEKLKKSFSCEISLIYKLFSGAYTWLFRNISFEVLINERSKMLKNSIDNFGLIFAFSQGLLFVTSYFIN
jgi:hypothetical protein